MYKINLIILSVLTILDLYLFWILYKSDADRSGTFIPLINIKSEKLRVKKISFAIVVTTAFVVVTALLHIYLKRNLIS